MNSIVHRLVRFSIRYPLVIVSVVAALTVLLGFAAGKIEIDADLYNLLRKDDRTLQLIERYGKNKDSGQLLLVVESESPYSIEKLRALQRAIEQIEKVDCVLGSITPFNFITFDVAGKRLKPVSIAVEARAPRNNEELAVFRRRLLNDPLARNLVLAGDASALAMVFPVEMVENYSDLIAVLDSVRADLEVHYQVYLTGAPVVLQETKNSLLRDVPKFLGLGSLVILLVLLISFRSRRAVILPLIVISLGTLWTIGTMALIGMKLSVVSIMVPPLVLTLGSSYSIHILNQYYREAKVQATDRKWIAHSVGHINRTILMAAVTTIIGFCSLMIAAIPQVRDFGLATSIGIAYCAVLSLFFFPAVLALLPPPKPKERDRVLKGGITHFMEKLSFWIVRYRYAIVSLVVLIAVGFGITLRFVTYQTNFEAYYREKEKMIQETQTVVEKLKGYTIVYLTLTAPEGSSKYFLEPENLRRIAALEDRLVEEPNISTVYSFTGYLRQLNFKLNGRDDLPATRAPLLLLSRYMKSINDSAYGQSLEGTMINSDFNQLTITLRIWDSEHRRTIVEWQFRELIDTINTLIAEAFPTGQRPVLWGRSLALLRISEVLARDQLYSVIASLALIFVFTAILFRSLKLGLFSLIPLLSGIMLNFVFMTLLSIPFDVVTVMFSSVAIGVGIDDSIHLLIRYREQLQYYPKILDLKDKQKVLMHTLKIAGRPILLTSLALIVGLLVLVFSRFMPILYFGLLVSLALVTTTFGALVILPAILSLSGGHSIK